MTAADLYTRMRELLLSEPDPSSLNRGPLIAGHPAFTHTFQRDGVLHARRADAAVTISPSNTGLVIRAWGFQEVADTGMIDLVAETRLLDSPDVEDAITHLRHTSDEERRFELSMLLAHQVLAVQQATKFPTLLARIPGLRLYEAGGVAPYWAEGHWHGYRVTFRARYQTATLKVLEADDSTEALWSASETGDDRFAMSAINDDEFERLFLHLATRLEVAPFPYRFADRARKPRYTDIANNPIGNIPFVGWGHSVEEARQRVLEHFVKMYPGQDPEKNVARKPLNTDERTLPAVRPAFTVLPD